MKMIRSLVVVNLIFATPILYAQTENQPYGDNPNIFRVLAHKTGEAIQNTADKVGNATERGIQKIKPSFDETIENTKNYTTEQATIARDNTRQGIDTAVKKVEQTKERITGKTSYNVPIEQGSLSQSSNNAYNTANNVSSATTMSVNPPIVSQPVQQTAKNQIQNNVQDEPEIKKQSLPIENNVVPSNSSSGHSNLNSTNISSAKDSTDDDSGVPR